MDRPARQLGFGFLGFFKDADAMTSESDLMAAALALSEQRWDRRFSLSSSAIHIREELRQGRDPLGDAFTLLRTPELRRVNGATYTPAVIVDAMANWALAFSDGRHPTRVIDPGAGSARFLMAAARRFPNAQLIGIEVDSLAALIARANLAASGLADRSRIILGDYRNVQLPPEEGRTLYIGNPPYVRHHLLTTEWKQWLGREAARLGYRASQLAGLHVHFFLATVLHAKTGDFGAFVTASEWLDVNYGRLVRELFLNELGGQGLTIIQPATKIFADAAVTSVIGTFEFGSKPAGVRVRHVKNIDRIEPLANGRLLDRGALTAETRWSRLAKPARKTPAGYVELGELCRVHRGQVTGSNRIWIAGRHSAGLPPSVLFRSVTKARELFNANGVLADENDLRMVIDLPVDLTGFSGSEKRAIDRFLSLAKTEGVADGYVASNRKAWWSVGLKSAAPILATYMARRPPAFVRNLVGARHINIAHGLYPRDPLAPRILDRLAAWLSQGTQVEDGRTYAGGLTKFEPREMERLLVPSPEMLAQ